MIRTTEDASVFRVWLDRDGGPIASADEDTCVWLREGCRL
jgi:hypothetical protein